MKKNKDELLEEYEKKLEKIEHETEKKSAGVFFLKKLYWEGLRTYYETRIVGLVDGAFSANNIFIHLLDILFSIFSSPYFLINRKVLKKNWSPFTQEWVMECLEYIWIGPALFVLIVIFVSITKIPASWPLLFSIFLIGIPALFVIPFTLFMPTVIFEFIDKIQSYPIKKQKMSMSLIRSFRTQPNYDMGSTMPLTNIVDANSDSAFYYPALLYCRTLPQDHIPKSSLKTKPPLSVSQYGDSEFDPSYCTNSMELTYEQKQEYKHKIKYILCEPSAQSFVELIEAEPTMEFQYTYLKHSKLLVRIDPIPGYDYDERVPALLEQFNQTVHPWLRDKVTFR
jgi:hypothetical protein